MGTIVRWGMRCIAFAVILGMLLCCGCRDRGQEQSAAESKGQGAGTPAAPPPSSADELIRRISARAKGRVLNQLTLRYVRPDGQMDPTYGSMKAEIRELPAPPPPDDPARPVGAPEPPRSIDMFSSECWILTWQPGGEVKEEKETFCGPTFGDKAAHQALRCNAAQIWKRARADGAPEGLAVISWTHVAIPGDGDVFVGQGWELSIRDAPRDISFRKEYPDDCEPVVERAPG